MLLLRIIRILLGIQLICLKIWRPFLKLFPILKFVIFLAIALEKPCSNRWNIVKFLNLVPFWGGGILLKGWILSLCLLTKVVSLPAASYFITRYFSTFLNIWGIFLQVLFYRIRSLRSFLVPRGPFIYSWGVCTSRIKRFSRLGAEIFQLGLLVLSPVYGGLRYLKLEVLF